MESALLRHREKRRYVAILYSETQLYKPFQLHEIIVKRFKELFGVLHCELAMIRLYDSEFGNTLLIGCKLKYLDNFLFALSMTQPPIIVIGLSGTLKKLRKRVLGLNLETLKTIEAKYKKGMR